MLTVACGRRHMPMATQRALQHRPLMRMLLGVLLAVLAPATAPWRCPAGPQKWKEDVSQCRCKALCTGCVCSRCMIVLRPLPLRKPVHCSSSEKSACRPPMGCKTMCQMHQGGDARAPTRISSYGQRNNSCLRFCHYHRPFLARLCQCVAPDQQADAIQ